MTLRGNRPDKIKCSRLLPTGRFAVISRRATVRDSHLDPVSDYLGFSTVTPHQKRKKERKVSIGTMFLALSQGVLFVRT